MNTHERNYRHILRTELECRCEKNPRYSLRAFARDLEITSSRLSEVMSGRYGLSREAAKKIGSKIGWNKSELGIFCDLVDAEHARSKKRRAAAKSRLHSMPSEYQQLTLDSFQVISDWYHFAILELPLLENFNESPEWIATRLGISPHVVRAAIERLKRLNLLTESSGRLQACDSFTGTPTDIPSEALRKFHTQLLEKALAAIRLQDVNERDVTNLVLAVDSAQMPEAKEEIMKFRRSFDARFGKAKIKNQIYCLGINFFRLGENIK